MHLKLCPVSGAPSGRGYVLRVIQLTVMGLGSESSFGQILQKGCPNSFVSFSAWQTLLVEPFLNFILLLTTSHLVSNGSKMAESVNFFYLE